MTFGFIPLSDPVLPVNHVCQPNLNCSVVELHSKIKEQYSKLHWCSDTSG